MSCCVEKERKRVIIRLGLKFFIYLVGKEIGGGHVEDKAKRQGQLIEAGPRQGRSDVQTSRDGLGLQDG